ncbi:MAG: phosphodiester glycosidase family protein [Paracholeplasma sp.]|nr:phosphodiester glycosidase family protein [Paracholeplasma sp.]MDY3195877.1 phosphodiester glycosidase family protein [Paracholeplasma sp.]
MKKLVIICLLLFLVPIQIYAQGLGYQITDETIYQNDGLIAKNIKAVVTNDSNIESVQNISILTNDGRLQTTTWSYLDPSGNLINQDVLTIAKDFELKHPGYEVIAAINGDYFTTNQSINSNVIFGSRIMNPVNHDKYFSIELNPAGRFFQAHKQVNLETYYAYFYDKDSNALRYVTPILPINQRISDVNQTAVYYNYSSINNTTTKHYSFDFLSKNVSGSHLSFSLINGEYRNDTIETTTQKASISSSNEVVNELLDLGVNVKVQKSIKGFSEGNAMVGVDSMIIEDAIVRSFDVMGGQSVSNNTARHPRTGIGFNENNEPMFFTVDGRQTGFSQGVNLREFAQIMKENGVIKGFNLDGGGSTQAVIKRNGALEIFNSPSEKSGTTYRRVANALLFIKPIEQNVINHSYNNEMLTLVLPSLNYDVYVNNIKQDLTSHIKNITIDQTMTTAVSVVNQLSNQVAFQTVFYQSMEKEPVLPTFEIEGVVTDPKFTINVSFVDPDQLIDRMYIINEMTEERQVALVKYMGLRSATFNELVEGVNTFTIYYELKNGTKDTLSYTYDKKVDEEVPSENQENSDSAWFIIIPAVGLITITFGIVTVKWRKK